MKKTKYLYVILTIIILIVAGFIYYFKHINTQNLTESEAILILKSTYQEFASYPNENLPPQSIRTEKDIDGWYISFVQEGSGRPILGAKCFFVNNDKSIRNIGEFHPSIEDTNFSIKTCSKMK